MSYQSEDVPLTSALIGFSGFVGGNLLRQHSFDALYNSKNIHEIAYKQFDLIVCAGAPAEKWKANQNPEADWQSLEKLLKPLLQAKPKQLILISTVDVYGKPYRVNEEHEPSEATPYGAHRLRLEKILCEYFPTLVIRLPGLFGTGLKKNAIYDLLHENQVQRIDSRGVFQFYGVDRLWQDIRTAREAGLSLIHFATEPVAMSEVARYAFGQEFHNEILSTFAHYDVQTRHASIYQGQGKYLQSKQQVLDSIKAFVASEQQQVKKCA